MYSRATEKSNCYFQSNVATNMAGQKGGQRGTDTGSMGNVDLKRKESVAGIKAQSIWTSHRLFGGGVPSTSSTAFLFDPNVNVTFVRSLGTGVLSCEAVPSSTVDVDILEKPGLGAGEPPFGSGLIVNGVCGAGRVMKPAASCAANAVSTALDPFLSFFSDLPFFNG
jgi:hypothetical protein